MSDRANHKSQDFQVVPMTTPDLIQVVGLATAADLNGWNQSDFENELANPMSLLFVGNDHNKILGFIFARLITTVVEIISIVVLPTERRLGVGQALLQKIIQTSIDFECIECWLEVRESNFSAVNFYLSSGFAIVGRRQNYYSNPFEDAILMTLVYSKKNPKK